MEHRYHPSLPSLPKKCAMQVPITVVTSVCLSQRYLAGRARSGQGRFCHSSLHAGSLTAVHACHQFLTAKRAVAHGRPSFIVNSAMTWELEVPHAPPVLNLRV